MIRFATLLLILLAAPCTVRSEDTPPAAEFSKALTSTKDVATLAEMLGKELHRPPELLLQMKDAASVATAKRRFQDAAASVAAISKRLQELPVPPTAVREAISKKMEAQDAANKKAMMPSLDAHMAAMPAGIKSEAMKEMKSFYECLDAHHKVFDQYFGAEEEKPATPAAEPQRAGGLSVHMLPRRVADLSKEKAGFTVSKQGGREPAKGTPTMETAQSLADYFKKLPPEIQQHGIWVVTTHPEAYSDKETKNLEKLKEICTKDAVPLFTCRGSELPGGWKRQAR